MTPPCNILNVFTLGAISVELVNDLPYQLLNFSMAGTGTKAVEKFVAKQDDLTTAKRKLAGSSKTGKDNVT